MKIGLSVLTLILIIVTLSFSFAQRNKSEVAYRVAEKDLIPEGITFSSSTNSFYLSSLAKNKIIQVDAETGKFKDFVNSEVLGQNVLGLLVDEKRNHLWACSYGEIDNHFFSIIAKFDLNTGKLVKAFKEKEADKYTVNDLAIDEDGNVYYTHMAKHAVLKINKNSNKAEEFISGDKIQNPNGITISANGKYLYVASANHGIKIIDIEKRIVINENNSIDHSEGLDGLKFYKNSLIAIENEVRFKSQVKICRFFLNEEGTKSTSMKIIDQNNLHFEIPTTCVIVNDNLYVLANSQMGKLSKIKEIDKSELNDTIILKYNL